MKTIFIKLLSPIRSPLFAKLGFTLIELLITISIIGIIFTLGLAKYNEFNRRQILAQAASGLRSNLRLAQNKAFSGEKDCSASKCGGVDGVCGTNDANERSLDGWYVSFTADSYQVYGQCGGVAFPDSPKTEYLTQRGITISSTTNPVHFKPLGLGASEAVTVTLSGYGPDEVINITVGGEIY